MATTAERARITDVNFMVNVFDLKVSDREREDEGCLLRVRMWECGGEAG
jgi:hypothetical protein